MKTVLYKNYDDECKFYRYRRGLDPFADCTNPLVFIEYGAKNYWVTSCSNCPHRDIKAKGFEYKMGVLVSKIEVTNGSEKGR